MIALSSQISPDALHERFQQMLPRIHRAARLAFRGRDPEAREEAVQETLAATWLAFTALARRGRIELAYPTVLARYAIAQVREGRRVGGRLNVRDVSSQYAQARRGFEVERLDEIDPVAGAWRAVLVESKNASPAASRIDFAAWLRGLPRRVCRIAKLLAMGETTSEVARRYGVSRARISQVRRELQRSWEAYTGEEAERAPLAAA